MPFGNIYIGGHFLGSREGEKRQIPQNAAQVAVCHRSEHYAVFIGCQHQRCPHYCLGQGTGVPLSLENTSVSFAACPVTIFAALPIAVVPNLVRTLNINSKVCWLCFV